MRITSLLIGILGWIALINGEYLCLDGRPVWGASGAPRFDCSGHIDELLRKWIGFPRRGRLSRRRSWVACHIKVGPFGAGV